MDGLYVVGLCSILILFLIALSVVVRVAVIVSPRFERYLDEQWTAPWREW